MLRRVKQLILFLGFICIGWFGWQLRTIVLEESSTFYPAQIVYVIDGDTVVVLYDDQEIKVRMIGIDTPESVSSNKMENTYEGRLASSFAKKELYEGRKVYLEFDEQRKDKYGRTLAYIWLSKDANSNSFEDFKKYNFGAILLQNTYCKPLSYAPNDKYEDWYNKLAK